MKKEERLHRLMGDIDDGLVAEAARRPVRKMVWMPIVAAAACVALTVGLWQGGVFDPAQLPVEAPNEGVSTTEVTDPTDTTADTTTTTTAKPTTPTTTEPYILVGGEDDYEGSQNEGIPSLKDRLVSPALEEKMKEYRDVNAVYQVVIFLPITREDEDELVNFIEADEEYQSLKKQYEEAEKAEKEASDRLHEAQVINDKSQIYATLLEEYREVEKIYNELSEELFTLRQELVEKFRASLSEERISYAAKYSKTEPIRNYCEYLGAGWKYGCYMELTADAINELADRGGYDFFLASNLGSFRPGFDDE